MKYEDIMKLLDAGYSRDEIIAMDIPPEETPKDETPKDETSKDETPAESSAISEALTEIKTAFEEMKKEMLAFNIMNSRQSIPEQQSVDDIMANIINPFEEK